MDILKRVDRAVLQLEASRPPRTHLGMSSLGDPCPRKVWLNWRWGLSEKFSPRILRLFNRGHREESQVIYYLRNAGFKIDEVDPNTGEQFEIKTEKGQCNGHTDGIIYIRKSKGVLEIKTHNLKSFAALKRAQSVKTSKFVHYCQMQIYMAELRLPWSLYVAVCKDNDSWYIEIVKNDPETIAWLNERKADLVWRKNRPARLSENSNFWLCNFCHYHDHCFSGQDLDINCRTCKYSRPIKNGHWKCLKNEKKLSIKKQLKGCRKHTYVL